MGCGTGAITSGIAELLGSRGTVLGADISPIMLEKARVAHGSVPNLEFVTADIYNPLELRLLSQGDVAGINSLY